MTPCVSQVCSLPAAFADGVAGYAGGGCRAVEVWLTALERHLDPPTARMVDALVEGLTIHRALDTEGQDPHLVREAVRRILREAP